MAVKTLHISDVSGDVIHNDDELVTMIVLDHALIEQPVQLDISAKEADGLDVEKDDFVIIELISDGGDKRERVVMAQAKFDAMFKTLEVDEVLADAEKYSYSGGQSVSQTQDAPRRGRPPGGGSAPRAAKPAGDKPNYKELPAAGLLHRGKTTAEEAEVVRNNLDEVNRNRFAAGQPIIDPMNEKDAARYGFDQIKEADRPKLNPEFKS